MQQTRLNLALLAALSIFGTTQSFAAIEINEHGVVVLNKDTYTTSDFNNAPATDKYQTRTITSAFAHYHEGVNLSGVDFKVTGGKAHRIYGAMIGHDTLSQPDAPSLTVSNNRLSVDGLSLDLSYTEKKVAVVGGGLIYHGTVEKNTVTISNTDIHDVYGGISHHGSANNNEVIVNEGVKAGRLGNLGVVYGLVIGGLVNNSDSGQKYNDAEKTNNNKVTINGSDDCFLGAAVGGIVRADQGHAGHASSNNVTLNSGWVGLLYGAESAYGNATNNVVTINGGLVKAHEKAASGIPAGVKGATSSEGEVRYNEVVINSGTVAVNVYAGTGVQDKTIVTDNQITINGPADLTAASLWGTNVTNGERNALNLNVKQAVRRVGQFNLYNFQISPDINIGDTLLLVEDGNEQNKTDISNATLNVYIDKDAKRLNPGEKITLISDNDGLITDGFEGEIIVGDPIKDYRVGFGLEANNASIADNTDLTITVLESRISSRTQSLLKGNLSRMAFVNQASDLVANSGSGALIEAAEVGRHWFVALQGGSNHYNMDSYIDLDGQSMMFGAAFSGNAFGGNLSIGAFIEGGQADYEMLDEFRNGSTMKGKGETDYRGVGIMAHYDQSIDEERAWWLEASVRAGRADLSYETLDWMESFRYDVSGNYVAAHLGAGYRMALSPTQGMNLFTKVFYNHHRGEDFMIESNPVQFDTLQSIRWRTGLGYEKMTQTQAGTRFYWQTSMAYEYEFDAVAKGRADGYEIHDSDLGGSTGVAQLAMTVVPASLPNTDLKAAIEAYAGTREGISGQIRLTHRF